MKIHRILFGALALAGVFGLTACDDDDEVNIYTEPIVEELTTGSAATTATTATVTGTVHDLSSMNPDRYTVGVVYSTDRDAVTTPSATRAPGALAEDGATVNTVITGLQPGATYYYAQYVTLQSKYTQYGEIQAFVTSDAKVNTIDAADITAAGATLGCALNQVDDLLEAGAAHGVLVADNQSLVDAQRYVAEGKESNFNVKVTELMPGREYFYAPYLEMNGAETLGEVKKFTTAQATAGVPESEDYVDMGTKCQWAKWNLGATAENQPGGLYGYGDMSGLNRSTDVTKYASTAISNTAADPAYVGGAGYAPTADDWNALLEVSTIAAETLDGTSGVRLTSTKTGNSIFLPLAGLRVGTEVTARDIKGVYAAATIDGRNSNYISAYVFENGAAVADRANRANGLSIRPVRPRPTLGAMPFDPEKVQSGDLEDNGNFRIEFYNSYGPTKADPAVDLVDVAFKKNMVVTFTLTGVTGNIKEGSPASYRAGMAFVAGNWWPTYFVSQKPELTEKDAIVNGDGTYRVVFDEGAEVSGAEVFCIDILGMSAGLVDPSKVVCTVESIQLDRDPARQTVDVDNTKTVFMGKEGGTVDGRLEIFNSTATNIDPSVDFSDVTFPAGLMFIKYTVSGISGNLKAGAKNSYLSAISFADGNWDPSYWGGSIGDRPVTGDGTYEIAAPLTAEAEGAAVWCIEFYGLYQDLVDPSLVKVNIDKVTVPGF